MTLAAAPVRPPAPPLLPASADPHAGLWARFLAEERAATAMMRAGDDAEDEDLYRRGGERYDRALDTLRALVATPAGTVAGVVILLTAAAWMGERGAGWVDDLDRRAVRAARDGLRALETP